MIYVTAMARLAFNFKPVKAMEENHWIDVTLYKRFHTTTHYTTFREPNLQL